MPGFQLYENVWTFSSRVVITPAGGAANQRGEDASQEETGSEQLQRLVVIRAVGCCL